MSRLVIQPRAVLKFSLLSVLLWNCSSRNHIQKSLIQSAKQGQHHTGFVLYDPAKKKTLASINGDKYFTPASNTKIFTLYAGLKLLGDSVPSLRYVNRNDSLIFWGTGDPSFLYSDVFQNRKTFNFLKEASGTLVFSGENFFDEPYGPGWAWDDYQDYYQAERSSLPIYGNIVIASKSQDITPSSFGHATKSKTQITSGRPLFPNRVLRERFTNSFSIVPDSLPSILKIKIPFITSSALTAQLLVDTLRREVCLGLQPLPSNAKTLYSISTDSLYKRMMKVSDNFIAEQILLMCAKKISDSLRSGIAIKKMMKEYLSDLPDAPIWVDGSGLSRYNQMTPRSIVKLWEKIYKTIPQQRLFPLLATPGQNGTLKNSLKNKPPFVFGKSGSLSNNYCLSGYLLTKKDRLLIFCSMNANVVVPTREVRENLEKILTFVYEHY